VSRGDRFVETDQRSRQGLRIGDDSLRRWLAKNRQSYGGGPDSELTLTERARLAQLERENRELRAEAAFLKKAALSAVTEFRLI
jgi:transposase-like protein